MALPFELRTPIPTTEPERLRPAARRTAVLRARACPRARRRARRRGPRRPQHRSSARAARPLGHDRDARPRPLGERLRGRVRPDDPQAGALGRTHRRDRVLGRRATSCCRRARPARELLPLLRFFRPEAASTSGELPVDPWKDFRAGTRISAGPACRARDAAARGANNGSIVLVSDLEILPDEVVRLSDVAAELARGRDRPADRAALPDAGQVRADPPDRRRLVVPARVVGRVARGGARGAELSATRCRGASSSSRSRSCSCSPPTSGCSAGWRCAGEPPADLGRPGRGGARRSGGDRAGRARRRRPARAGRHRRRRRPLPGRPACATRALGRPRLPPGTSRRPSARRGRRRRAPQDARPLRAGAARARWRSPRPSWRRCGGARSSR